MYLQSVFILLNKRSIMFYVLHSILIYTWSEIVDRSYYYLNFSIKLSICSQSIKRAELLAPLPPLAAD